MKREISPPSKKMLILYRVSVALLLAVVLALAVGTIIGLSRPSDAEPLLRFGSNREKRDASPGRAAPNTRPGPAGEATSVFSGLGTFRIPVAGESSATLVLSVSFPYPANDRPFTEELASRIGDFRTIATYYFTSLPAEKLVILDEDAAKTEILRQYNALLRLGKIETLYFSDLMIVE
ncbi:MAG: flagellar basal body protein FliL [Treponema sp.]|nr:flagellar basal body protein FliL [Treponema sp.]